MFIYAGAVARLQKNVELQADSDVFTSMSLTDYDGKVYTHDTFANSKLTFINVWETTCSACIAEFPDLQEVTQELDPSKVQFVGVCADLLAADGSVDQAMVNEAKSILNDSGVTFLQLIPDNKTTMFIHSVISGYPTTFVVDSEGKIIDSFAGGMRADDWRAKIAEYADKAA